MFYFVLLNMLIYIYFLIFLISLLVVVNFLFFFCLFTKMIIDLFNWMIVYIFLFLLWIFLCKKTLQSSLYTQYFSGRKHLQPAAESGLDS